MVGAPKNTKTKDSMTGFFGNHGLTTIQNASPLTAMPNKTQRRIFMKVISPAREKRRVLVAYLILLRTRGFHN